MANYRTGRFMPVALVIIIIIIAIVGLVYVARVLFFPGNAVLPSNEPSQTELLNTSSDRAVSMQVRGNIVADENFRTYQIEVSPSQRTLTLYKGYELQAFDSIRLGNNTPAYEQFVYALDRAKMMDGNEFTGERNDTRGICATGFLYQFQILQSDQAQKTLWSTSCSAFRGSLVVNQAPLVALFIKQIPGAQDKISDLWQ